MPKLSTCACAIAVTCGPRVARNEYNYLCIAHAEDTIVLWRTGVVHVLGPACTAAAAAAAAAGPAFDPVNANLGALCEIVCPGGTE